MRVIPRALLPLVLLSNVGAQEEVTHTLSLVAGVVPGVRSVHIKAVDTGSAERFRDHEGVDQDGSPGLTVCYTARFQGEGALQYGPVVGLFRREHRGSNLSTSATLLSWGVELGGDVGTQLSPQVRWSVGPRAGLGRARQSEDGLGVTDDGQGYYLSYGAQAQITWQLEHGVELGTVLGYQGFVSTARRNFTENDTTTKLGDADVVYTGRGFLGGIIVGYRY